MLKRGFPVSFLLTLLLGFALTGNAAASSAIGLGTADSFAVLGASAVTNTGPSVINGDLGVSPQSAVTGFPPGIVNGTIYPQDAVAAQAQADLTTAYNNAAGQACNTDLTGKDLGGMTLTAGVYCFSSSAGLTGALTLNAKGVAGARFIFQIGSTLTTASSSTVNLINGAQPCNVFWQIASSATIGTSTSFVGNIMAYTSITMTTGATLQGRALARNGAVTLDTNTITPVACDTRLGSGGSGGSGGSIGGPCNDPAYYGVFDNTSSNVVVRFRMKWTTTTGLKVAAVYVPAGSIYRTWEHWAKPGTKVQVSYKDPNSGKWINVASVTAAHGRFAPCVYKHGFDTP
ncbi:MAG TPA: ice-binding family protein [Candidatus Limnocylindrales bacterium]